MHAALILHTAHTRLFSTLRKLGDSAGGENVGLEPEEVTAAVHWGTRDFVEPD